MRSPRALMCAICWRNQNDGADPGIRHDVGELVWCSTCQEASDKLVLVAVHESQVRDAG